MIQMLELSDKDFKAAIEKCFEKKSYILLKKMKTEDLNQKIEVN